MKIGSLFSGIGGLEFGLEAAGVGQTIWQCEIDPFNREVLAKHWPNAIRFSDVRTIGEGLPPVDVICGGFPCTDVSTLNPSKQGLDGASSGLWFEMLRVIRRIRPRYVVVENVPNLANRGFSRVLRGLAESGYDAQWQTISGRAVGAPQERSRLFIVAYSNRIRREEPHAPSGLRGLGLHYRSNHAPAAFNSRPWDEPQPSMVRVAAGFSAGLDRSRISGIGRSVIPQVAYQVGRWLLQIDQELM